MHLSLSTLSSISLASILFNTPLSHGHQQQLLRGGGKLLIPELPSTENLIGTNWQLKEIHGVPAIILPQPQSLFFETDTVLSGYDGCNLFHGIWDTVVPPSSTSDDKDNSSIGAHRQRISIGSLSTTLKGCETPEAEEQKSIFMGVLSQKEIDFSLSADKQELTLYGPLGSHRMLVPIVLTKIPNPPQPHERLVGTSWVATNIVYPDSKGKGVLRPVLIDHPVTLTFTQDEIKGSTGTNEFYGDVTHMTAMEFGVTNVAHTYMGWEDDTDPRRSQERAWMDIIASKVDEINTIPYELFEERIGDTDEWTKVLVLGSSSRDPLARFVPLQLRDDTSVPRYEDIPIVEGGGKSLIGMKGEEAKAVIMAIDPSFHVQIVPEGSMVSRDLREDRVRIFVDKHGDVTTEPKRG